MNPEVDDHIAPCPYCGETCGNAATLETIAQYVANVLNDSYSLPDWWTPHTMATTINRIITAAPMPAKQPDEAV